MSKSNPGDESPYSAPAELAVEVRPEMEGLFFTDRMLLYVKDGAELPPFCVRTGEPTGSEDRRKVRKFSWAPPWVRLVPALLIFTYCALQQLKLGWMSDFIMSPWRGLLVVSFLIVVVLPLLTIFSRKAWVTYDIAASVIRRIEVCWLTGVILVVSGMIAMISGLLLAVAKVSYLVFPIAMLLLLASVPFLLKAYPIKVSGYQNGWFKLTGCAPEFLEKLPFRPAPF